MPGQSLTAPFSSLSERGQARRLRPLAISALDAYDLTWTRLRLLTNSWNCVFRVDTPDGPLAFRVSRPIPTAESRSAASEARFMCDLTATTGLAVPAVLPTRDGELTTTAVAAGVPEPRICVLFGWLGGSALASAVSPERWEQLGALMARMHRFADSWTPPADFTAATYDRVFPYGEPTALFDPSRIELFGLDSLLREAYAATQERIDVIGTREPRIVVHGDLHSWNVKVLRGVLAAFDFEDLLWAAPLLDVSTSLWYVRDRDDYAALGQAFRLGYERERPWVEHEPGEVDRLMAARALDLLNSLALDPGLDVGDQEAFVRRRGPIARIAVGSEPAVSL